MITLETITENALQIPCLHLTACVCEYNRLVTQDYCEINGYNRNKCLRIAARWGKIDPLLIPYLKEGKL